MVATWIGPLSWELERDAERERTYTLLSLVECSSYSDGPLVALGAVGLPVIGQIWSHGNDNDPYAYCLPTVTVTPVVTNEPNRFFVVKNIFSTKPHEHCGDEDEDPLLHRPKTSGNSIFYSKEARYDRFGNQLKNSAHEFIEGKDVEIEVARHVIHVEMNVSSLELHLMQSLLNHVNDSPLWGMPRRCVRFAGWDWEAVFLGTCDNCYIRLSMDFELDIETFDRCIPDKGFKMLKGRWATEADQEEGLSGYIVELIDGEVPDPTNPAHFIRAQDRLGENTEILLNGSGLPLDALFSGTGTGTNPDNICIGPNNGPSEILHEANLLLLGIPTDLGCGISTSVTGT